MDKSKELNRLDRRMSRTKELQAELDHRTEVEEKVFRLFSEGKFEEGKALLDTLDDEKVLELAEGDVAAEKELASGEHIISKWRCTAHWLDSLYQDFVRKVISGEENADGTFPCNTCEIKSTCKMCPVEMFEPLSVISGIQIKRIHPRTQQQSVFDRRGGERDDLCTSRNRNQ